MAVAVRSIKSLTDQFAEHFGALATKGSSFAPADADPERIAIFGIHGISPTQRYAFQDQLASSLRSALDAFERIKHPIAPLSWNAVVYWPRGSAKVTGRDLGDAGQVRPSALRIYRSDDNPEDPTGTVYDVYEGYWSPLSKGKTNIASALRWILNSTFLATSSTANLPCTREKLRSDFVYIGALGVGMVVAFVLALIFGLTAWSALGKMLPAGWQPQSLFGFLANPIEIALKLPPQWYLEFAVDAIGAYVLAQLVVIHNVSKTRRARTEELIRDASTGGTFEDKTVRAAVFHKYVSGVLWVAFALVLIAAVALALINGHAGSPVGFVVYSACVVAAVALSQIARSAADFAIENMLGDIQIYTTRDENSTFFSIRQQIIATVTAAFIPILSSTDSRGEEAPFYHRVHVFGHSLGSTIAMDMLIGLRQMVEERQLPGGYWGRIRSLTTFGTALEKTRFLFDVRKPTVNAAQDQFENDVYGRFFSDNVAALRGSDNAQGIYWSNLWYMRDIVANAIVSYTSDVQTGNSFVWSPGSPARPICRDFELPHDRPRFAWVHGDYLADPLFWEKVAPVIA